MFRYGSDLTVKRFCLIETGNKIFRLITGVGAILGECVMNKLNKCNSAVSNSFLHHKKKKIWYDVYITPSIYYKPVLHRYCTLLKFVFSVHELT